MDYEKEIKGLAQAVAKLAQETHNLRQEFNKSKKNPVLNLLKSFSICL